MTPLEVRMTMVNVLSLVSVLNMIRRVLGLLIDCQLINGTADREGEEGTELTVKRNDIP
jgi:hypothetical protein